MSAIPCSSVSLKTMADGTLRISFDIEPMHAQDAFRLFAAPGTPAAIAALAVGYAAVQPAIAKEATTATPDKPKGGALSIEAASMCRHPVFLEKWGFTSEEQAKQAMCEFLGINSRSEIDHNEDVKTDFITNYRAPFMKHLIARGIVA